MICGFSFLVMLLIEEVGHSAHESMETKHCHSAEASTESQENYHNAVDGKENHNGHAHPSSDRKTLRVNRSTDIAWTLSTETPSS